MNRFARGWTDLSLRGKGLVVVAIPLAALLTATLFLFAIQRRGDEQQSVVREILKVRHEIQTVYTLFLNAETGIRGYGLSGKEDFLTPYSHAFERLPAALAGLEEVVGDRPGQLANARRIRFMAGQTLEVLAQIRKAGGSPGGIGERLLEESDSLMGELRNELENMQRVEENRLEQQVEALERSRRTEQIAFAAAVILGLAGGLVAAWLFTTGIGSRVEKLERSARRLAQGAPLPDRPSGSDELGRLAGALGEASALLTDREQRLTDARDSAEHASWAKSDFLGRTSHELRTPLSAIMGFSQFLHSHKEMDEESKELMGRVIKASQHLSRLLNDLIDIARIEAGHLDVRHEPVDVKEAVFEAVGLLSGLAAEHNVSLTVEGTDRTPPAIGDEQRLRQVLLNLLSNAIKYNRRDGNVRVGWETGDRTVTISVSDEGEGIAPEDLDRLFEPYDRLGAERTKTKGTGLGLPISKSLVELMGGRLLIDSAPGRGSTFSVELPASEPPPEGTPAPTAGRQGSFAATDPPA